MDSKKKKKKKLAFFFNAFLDDRSLRTLSLSGPMFMILMPEYSFEHSKMCQTNIQRTHKIEKEKEVYQSSKYTCKMCQINIMGFWTTRPSSIPSLSHPVPFFQPR